MQSRADLDPVLEKQLKSLQAQANAEQTARLAGHGGQWMMPEKLDWEGDLFALQDLEKPFSREQANAWFVDAIRDAANPGSSGDLIVTSLQADCLAILERAFRSRHASRRPRALVHLAGRKRGHGHNKGPLVQSWLEFLRGLVKEAKS